MLALMLAALGAAAAAPSRALEFGSMSQPTCEAWTPQEPIIPGYMPGITKPRILLAQDIDYPPYAYLAVPPEGLYDVAGFGYDFAHGMADLCGYEMEITQTDWNGCWIDGKIGDDAKNGVYHGCMTYTHTVGARPRFMEFSHAILDENKPAGLITLLDGTGKPKVDPLSDLSGLKVVDVNGWAPTADGLAVSKNACNGQFFQGYEWVTIPQEVTDAAKGANDAAMAYLQQGGADAMWIYADQAYHYDCSRDDVEDVQSAWDCDLWSGLGTKYAYIHTGIYEAGVNGTTLSMSKKGSGTAALLNPCIAKFIQTKAYYDLCVKHSLVDSCYKNAYFPDSGGDGEVPPWELDTHEQTNGCVSGYCGCADGGAA